MYNIKANPAKNRLYLTLRDRLDLADLQAGVALTLAEAKKLKPGFDVISDIAEARPTSEEARMLLQHAMAQVKELGMGRVVRVVSDTAMVAANQWQRTSRNAAGYTADHVATVEQAEMLLDRAPRA